MEKALNDIVGTGHVFVDPETLENYSRDRSLFKPGRASYVVKPGSTEEIQAIIKLANKTLIPITPVSSGAHFNGAAIPHQGGIILDLRRMNKILNIDRRNRAVRIEPGVTWGQIKKELKAHDLMPLPPLLPHPLKSALTSTLEREPMLIPKTEYGEPALTMEAVLPNGEIFRTGSACVGPPDEIQTDLVGPSGPGLDWFRLFQGAQGSFCIVTWMNMKAPPLPKREKVFFIPFQKIEKAVEPLYAILRGMLGAELFILNRFNLACILAKKWPDDFKTLRKALPPFTLILCLSGGRILPKEKINYQEADLRKIAHRFRMKLETSLPVSGGNKGIAVLNLLRSPCVKEPYWKERFKERCCDIFFYTTLDRVPYFTQLVNKMASSSGYNTKEIGHYFQPLEGGRACCLEFNFPWNTEEKEKVHDLYLNLSKSLVNEGAFFARPYGQWSELVYNRNSALTATLTNLKRIFDPNQIMNPGKLCF
jgi:FAD/FMN-containing dehydrogenase